MGTLPLATMRGLVYDVVAGINLYSLHPARVGVQWRNRGEYRLPQEEGLQNENVTREERCKSTPTCG